MPLSRLEGYLEEEEITKLRARFSSAAAVWGVTPGVSGGNMRKWERMREGDLVVLYRNRTLFMRGTVEMKLHSRELATDLWSLTADGQTWEHIYLLNGLETMDIPIGRFNRALGYAESNVVQGFNVYDGAKAEAIIELLELPAETIETGKQPTSREAFAAALASLESTDAESSGKRRKEAQLFRQYLFGESATGKCHICGRTLPIDLLVGAHIKPRASCTEKERRTPEVVMSACRLGCDELFEKSYLQVDESGLVHVNPAICGRDADVATFAASLNGRTCLAFNNVTKPFFDWKRQHPRRVL